MKNNCYCERQADCHLKDIQKGEIIKDSVYIPREFKDIQSAINYILQLSTDKRGHIMFKDHVAWLELKMKSIATISRKVLKMIK